MQAEENRALVRRFVEEVQSGGRHDLIDEYLDAGFVDHSAMSGFEPTREGVRQLVTAFRTAFPDLQFTIQDQVADGNRVVTRKTLTGVHRGEFMGIPATGSRIEVEVIDVLRVDDGRITDHWMNGDFLGLMQQLGAVPAPA